MNRWGLPPDTFSWGCGALGLLLLVAAFFRVRPERLVSPHLRHPAWLSVLSFFLSLGYVQHYLGGAPRIIDATTYWLQAHTYASASFGFTPVGPEASSWGRFLLSMPDGRLSGIFPPGYPALLAVFVLAGIPMGAGPAIAAATTWLTYRVAQLSFGDETLSWGAALLSTLCAALRYHTADTMSHGLSALLVLLCMQSALSVRGGTTLGGIALGWLVATRPVTGLVLAFVVALIEWSRTRQLHTAPARWRWLGWCWSSIGIGALLWQQHAVTGSWFESSQLRYYALSDWPEGCFHLGWGANRGCRHEHGPFVATYMPNGYGVLETLGTTARRLALHLRDAGNLELFGVLALASSVGSLRVARARWLGLTVLLVIAAYAMFYFDGNYPGGGARMFADVLPLEHMLLSWFLVHIRSLHWFAPLALLGFSVHTSYDHLHLKQREGGAPMFERARVEARLPAKSLVFVTTDHGFHLGLDPSDPTLHVVRGKRDALDFGAWQALGRPPSYWYHFDPSVAGGNPKLNIYLPPATTRFEMENQWPPAELSHGTARQRSLATECTRQGLWLEPAPAHSLTVEVSLWVPHQQSYRLRVAASTKLQLDVAPLVEAETHAAETTAPCWYAETTPLALPRGNLRLRFSSHEPVLLDFVEVLPVHLPASPHLDPIPH